MNTFRKWCRLLHRDLSYLFAGMLLVYAVSGIALNHKSTFNSQYDVSVRNYTLDTPLPSRQLIDQQAITDLILRSIDEEDNYTKHYFPNDSTLKIFLKSGSNVVVDLPTGHVTYERVRRRPILGALSRLHYNPGSAWTVFSDIFACAMIVVILTGLLMLRGKHGLWGWGGVELLLGIALPLLFMLI